MTCQHCYKLDIRERALEEGMVLLMEGRRLLQEERKLLQSHALLSPRSQARERPKFDDAMMRLEQNRSHLLDKEQPLDRAGMIYEVFRGIDANDDLGISLNEFFEAGKIVHSDDPNAWTKDKCDRHFERIDANKNGSICREEFTDFLLKVTKRMDDTQFLSMIEKYRGVRRDQDKQTMIADRRSLDLERHDLEQSRRQVEAERQQLQQERLELEQEKLRLGSKMSQLSTSAASGLFGESVHGDMPPETPRDTRRALGVSTWLDLNDKHPKGVSVWVASVYIIGLPAPKRPPLWRQLTYEKEEAMIESMQATAQGDMFSEESFINWWLKSMP